MAVDETWSRSATPAERLDAALHALRRPQALTDLAAELLDRQLAVTRAVAGVVALLSDEGRCLDLAAASGYDTADLTGWARTPVQLRLPLHEAVREDRVVVVGSVEELVARYPDARPSDDRPHALAAIPLRGPGGEVLGGVGLRFDVAGDVDLSDDVLAGEVVSIVAGGRLGQERVVAPLRARIDQLQRALDSRVAIEQAKGVLAERHRVNVDRAFKVMRRYARNGRRNLHDVAAAVMSGDEDPFVVN